MAWHRLPARTLRSGAGDDDDAITTWLEVKPSQRFAFTAWLEVKPSQLGVGPVHRGMLITSVDFYSRAGLGRDQVYV